LGFSFLEDKLKIKRVELLVLPNLAGIALKASTEQDED